ncbi:MAG: hypothetical protein ACI8WB_001813 [Phenylobacterium sp.]|jgi:uncharacterized protein YqiB (DUF1249 family)
MRHSKTVRGENHLTDVTKRGKYVPDLQGFLVLCELNYVRLLKLLPDIEPSGAFYDYHIRESMIYRLTIKEVCKYTTIINMKQLSPLHSQFPVPTMEIRLYHDAQSAEVTSSQNISRVKPSYQYPNPQMMQRDEKMQMNNFLQDWLKLCHQYGQVSVDLSSY